MFSGKSFSRLLLPVLLVIAAFSLQAQDIHFTQYYTAQQSLNPALCGYYDGDFRIALNNRSQWKQIGKPFRTLGIGLDKQFYLYNDKISAGLLVIQDKSGINLAVNKFLLTGAYHKNFSALSLHGGLQLGYTSKNSNVNALTYPSQLNWDKGVYDASLPNQENNTLGRISSFDLNLGAGISKKFKRAEPLIACSFFHVNTPKESFFNKNNQQSSRISIYTEIPVNLNQQLMLIPRALMMMQSGASELLLGTNLNIQINNGKGIIPMVFCGTYYRMNKVIKSDAVSLTGGARYKNYELGLSYDVNVSPLHVASSYRGAFEISFLYTTSSTRLKKTIIPCERF